MTLNQDTCHMTDRCFYVFQFNPVSPLSSSDPSYNSKPSPGDRVHVLVCVLSANSTEIKESVLQKMADIREAASEMGKSPPSVQSGPLSTQRRISVPSPELSNMLITQS